MISGGESMNLITALERCLEDYNSTTEANTTALIKNKNSYVRFHYLTLMNLRTSSMLVLNEADRVQLRYQTSFTGLQGLVDIYFTFMHSDPLYFGDMTDEGWDVKFIVSPRGMDLFK